MESRRCLWQVHYYPGFHLENVLGGQLEESGRNLDFKGEGVGGMMAKNVTKFHKCHLRVSGYA